MNTDNKNLNNIPLDKIMEDKRLFQVMLENRADRLRGIREGARKIRCSCGTVTTVPNGPITKEIHIKCRNRECKRPIVTLLPNAQK